MPHCALPRAQATSTSMAAIDAALLQQGLVYARQELCRPRYGFYDKLRDRDGALLIPAVEQSIATSHALRRQVVLEGSGVERETMLNAYCTFAAGVRGGQLLPGAEGNGLIDAPLKFSLGEYAFLDQLLTGICGRISAVPRTAALDEFGQAAFRWMRDAAVAEAGRETYGGLVRQLERNPLRIGDQVLRGFRTADTCKIRYRGSLDRIVGNREAKRTLLGALHNVLSYDAETGENIVKAFYDFPERFLIYGNEGTGKTSLLRAIAAEGQRIAETHGIPFAVRELSNAFKNEYYSVSARNLRELFAEINSGASAFLVLCEDIDTIFSSRGELKGRGGEDKAVLGEMLNLLEGASGEGRGNLLFAATTNAPESLDAAFAARLRQCQLHVPGPETTADYTALFQQKLGRAAGNLKAADWENIGRASMGHALSGRAVRNIAMRILDGHYGGPKSEQWFAEPSMRGEVLRSKVANISAAVLDEAIAQYAGERI